MERSTTLVVVLLVVVVVWTLAAASLTSPTLGASGADPAPEQVDMTQFSNETGFFPYVSQERSFDRKTGPINVVIRGDPELTYLYLRASADLNETSIEQRDLDRGDALRGPENGTLTENGTFNVTRMQWREARGATRYAYLVDYDADQRLAGRWVTESYQLHDGDYFGTRYHFRAYVPGDPRANLTLIQAHHEHWDWFALAHTVDGNDEAQTYAESELTDRRFVDSVSRVNLGNDDAYDTDGWTTVVDLAAVVGLVLVSTRSLREADLQTRLRAELEQVDELALLLFAALVAIVLFVRLGALAVESRAETLSPYVIAAAFYPLLAVGLPLVTAALARDVDEFEAFVITLLGFGTAILLDYAVIGVSRLPFDVVVHRAGLVLALGILATGASREERSMRGLLGVGVVAWLVLLALPLLGFA